MTDTLKAPFLLDGALKPRIAGEVRWEHAEPVKLPFAVNSLAASPGKMVRGNFRKPGEQYAAWALYSLSTTQGGEFDGTALVLVYGNGGFYDRSDPDKWVGTPPTAWRVAICKHEKVEGAGARPNFGWHPGRCTKCGMDMTVDSGD
jgi:hypothetical protein